MKNDVPWHKHNFKHPEHTNQKWKKCYICKTPTTSVCNNPECKFPCATHGCTNRVDTTSTTFGYFSFCLHCEKALVALLADDEKKAQYRPW